MTPDADAAGAGKGEEGILERRGVEPVPEHLRTVAWHDLFALLFTFNLSPLVFVLGALAVIVTDLTVWWAAAAMGLGTLIGNLLLVVVARVGVDYGVPGQVAMRATFGVWGARGLTSPYRLIAATYWFAAQALASAYGVVALVRALTGHELRLVPVSIVLGALGAGLAIVGFDALRYFVRIVLPLTVIFTATVVALFVATDDPAFAVSRALESPGRAFTWAGFAAFVTVMWGGQLSLVTNVADFCRYVRSRRHMQIGLITGAPAGSFVAGWVGAYAAVAIESTNPFDAIAGLTGNDALLVILLVALVAQAISVNVTNVYTGGLSLVNAIPRLGRLVSTVVAGAASVALAAFPELIEEAQSWFTHLGNVAAPLTGVIIADYAIIKRCRLDVPGLFDPSGPYRYLAGVNPAALLATGAGVAVFYAVPDGWIKAAWGVGVGLAAYLALALAQARLAPSVGPLEVTANRLSLVAPTAPMSWSVPADAAPTSLAEPAPSTPLAATSADPGTYERDEMPRSDRVVATADHGLGAEESSGSGTGGGIVRMIVGLGLALTVIYGVYRLLKPSHTTTLTGGSPR
jgi:purine-cytosine permease-like protein